MYKLLVLALFFSVFIARASVVKEDSFYNKYYLSSFLLETYGEKISTIIQEKIIKRGDVFSGACDPYSIIKKGKRLYRKNYGCFKGFHEMNKSPLGKKSAIRTLLINEICSEILATKGSLEYSLRGIDKRFNFVNFSQYSEIFNLKVDKAIFNEFKKEKAPWAVVSKVFCRSEKWQKP
ncbi:MAG: hypothetical protein ACJAT2_000243 [Bacteriovoracaceae bacterium]|jgi:hypothetical protein